ncbi:uncharacterized protein LOC129283345 [Lytechinus pictus]|uniref:uncharacterized protein LOC129283345 n=1 Tax=Lytechinus pictus TaxID=7653 RepID=UPI0030B9CE51
MMELHGLFLGFIIFVSSWLLCKAGVHPKDPVQTAEIGTEGRVIYDVHERLEPDPSHLCPDFECRTPHGPCNNTDKYQVVSFSEPTHTHSGYEYECGIRITDVSDSDAGVYMICKKAVNGCLIGNDMNVTLSVWRRDSHGRICTTTFDSTTRKRSNNCTLLTIIAPTTTGATTTTGEVATTSTDKNTVQSTESGGGSGENDAVVGKPTEEGKQSLCKRKIVFTAVGVLFFTLFIVGIFMVIWRRYRRRRCGGRRNDYELGVQNPNGFASLSQLSSNRQAIHGDSEDNESD